VAKKCNRGFTLLEVLVVLVIVAVMAGMITASIGDSPQRTLNREAERLQQVMQLAVQEAVLQGQEFGISLHRYGYQIRQFDPRDARWHSPMERMFERYRLPQPIQLSLSMEGSASRLAVTASSPLLSDDKPAVLFFSSGELSPFLLRLEHPDADDVVELMSDGINGVYRR
jgi:general secretion pathway protein H